MTTDCTAGKANANSIVSAIESDLRRNIETLDLSLQAVRDGLSRPEFLGALRATRNRVNSGNYWLFSPDAKAASHADEVLLELDRGVVLELDVVLVVAGVLPGRAAARERAGNGNAGQGAEGIQVAALTLELEAGLIDHARGAVDITREALQLIADRERAGAERLLAAQDPGLSSVALIEVLESGLGEPA